MKIYVNGYTVSGNPKEISQFLTMLTNKNKQTNKKYTTKVKYVPPQIEETVRKSQELRKTLEEDPAYNPYPGVITPQTTNPSPVSLGHSSQDTGVQYGI